MIHTSQHHWCVRKLYALQKDGRRHIEGEFAPCVDYTQMDKKYQTAFDYCQRKVHKLEFYPSRKKNISCQKAKNILRDFLVQTNSDVILYKGGHFEKEISSTIGVEAFNIEVLGVKKVQTHDSKDEIHLHYKELQNIKNGDCNESSL